MNAAATRVEGVDGECIGLDPSRGCWVCGPKSSVTTWPHNGCSLLLGVAIARLPVQGSPPEQRCKTGAKRHQLLTGPRAECR